MKSLFLTIVWVALAASFVYAQTEVKESHKSVNVEVEQEDDGKRMIVVSINEDGEEKKIKWEDDGTIPEDIRKMLEEEDIDVSMFEVGDDEEEVVVRVRAHDDGKGIDKEVSKRVIIKMDEDGESNVMEWDGEGEMPEDIKKLLEEHDIDIDELTEEAVREKRGERGYMKEKHKRMKKRAMRRGHDMNKEREIEFEIETDEDGKKVKKKMMWIDDEGSELHMEGDHDIIMLGGKGKGGKDKNIFFFEEGTRVSDAYMGAQIESADDGAAILELMKDSPADKAGLAKGDIVKKVNGARTKSMEDLASRGF